MVMSIETVFLVVAAVVVGVMGTARATRLISQDSFPPSAWLRDRWRRATDDGEWSVLITCPFCLSMYLTAANLAWALLSDLHISWWIVNGWLAASYAVAMVVVRDGE